MEKLQSLIMTKLSGFFIRAVFVVIQETPTLVDGHHAWWTSIAGALQLGYQGLEEEAQYLVAGVVVSVALDMLLLVTQCLEPDVTLGDVGHIAVYPGHGVGHL